MKYLLLCLLVLFLSATYAQAYAKTHRSTKQRNAFERAHPCPSTGERSGACPGYIVDHIIPLCADGPDDPSNMQWQTIEDAKLKDREERSECRTLTRARRDIMLKSEQLQ